MDQQVPGFRSWSEIQGHPPCANCNVRRQNREEEHRIKPAKPAPNVAAVRFMALVPEMRDDKAAQDDESVDGVGTVEKQTERRWQFAHRLPREENKVRNENPKRKQ